MSGSRYNMQSRYSKANGSSTSSLHFGSGGPSALSLYTNKTPANKGNTSSGYTSDHYSNTSSLHSFSGYISDICSTSHVSKPSYPSNTYGSSPGVKTYSSFPYSSSASVSRNLSTNTSRMPTISYSNSYSNGYARNISPNSSHKYVSYNTKTNSQNNYSNHKSDTNNNRDSDSHSEVTNKAPADFTSDSEDDSNDVDMRTHTNVIVTSRSTSPNKEIRRSRIDSISATQQIIRPKKIVFGVSTKKSVQQTQVTEQDLKDSLQPPVPKSPARSPCRSLTPTYTPTPALSPNLSPNLSPTPTHTPSHSPSPVRMRYGCTPNRRAINNSNTNRYSMPVIRSPTFAADYSNYSSISDSNTGTTESKVTAQPSQPSTSNETKINQKKNSLETMPAISERKTNEQTIDRQINNNSNDQNLTKLNSDQNNNNLLSTDSKTTPHRRSIIRLSPTILRRRRSQSRGKLSGRSRSRSKEKFLDREESSTTLTSSSDEGEDQSKSGSDRHSRVRKKRNSKAVELNKTNSNDSKGSLEGINEVKPTQNDCISIGSTSAEHTNNAIENNSSSRSNESTNESSSSSEKVIIKMPSLKAPVPTEVGPTIVVTKLPIKIKDPYSTETECDETECEFIDESDVEKFSTPDIPVPDLPVLTMRLTSTPEKVIISEKIVEPARKSSSETLSESSDNSSSSFKSVRSNDSKRQNSKTVINDESTERIETINTPNENKNNGSVVTNCDQKNNSNDKSMDGFRDNQTNILSDFDCSQSQRVECFPFPKEDNDMKFKSLDSKDVCLRDSGFSESSTRPDSPYDNLKPIAVSNENVCEITQNMNSNESVSNDKQFISDVNDIDSLLTDKALNEQSFADFERKFQNQNQNKLPVNYMKDEARNSLSLFISKCQDIDEMIGPMGPTSPLSPNQANNFNSSQFCKIFEQIEEECDSVAISASDVKVHNAKAMKSTVEAYTEEIDSSAVRIRENKALSVHLSKITEEIEEDFNQILVNKMYEKSTTKLDDCTLQLYKYGTDHNECDYANYLDLEATIDEQSEEFDCFTLNRRNAVILRTQLSVRVHTIIEKLLNSSGRDLRRALFSLKQIFQDDKDLVHEFVRNDGLACLIKVGSEADQNYQNYILRALGQVMLYVDGMNGVIEHNETIQWLYTLISSQYRLVVKTALKLLLVFVEYADSNCKLLVNSIETVDNERGVKPWTNVMNIMNEKDSADIELLIFSMTLINKTLNGISDQDTYYDITDAIEEQGMERIIQHYMSKQGTDHDLLQQFRTYEAVLRHEDGDDDGRGLPDSQKIILRRKSGSGLEEDRRKSRRHSFGTISSGGSKLQTKTNKKCEESLPSWHKKVLQQTEQFNKKFFNSNNNINSNIVSNGFDDTKPTVRIRRERDARQKTLIKEQEKNNQRSSISSCSSADSYGSYASYGSYGSGEEKPSLIETIKILPNSMKFDKNVEDLNKKNNQLSFQNNQNINSNKWENNNNISNNNNNNNNNLFNNLNNNNNNNNNFKNDVSNNKSTETNGHTNGHYVLTKQNSVNDKKAWMLSMMYGKTDETTHLVNGKPQIAPTNTWSQNTNNENIEIHMKSTESVRNIKERIMKPVNNTPVTDPIINGSIQRILSAKESLSDPKSHPEYLQWDQLVNSLSRPLLINDLDFTDLRDDDDADICAPTANSSLSNTPPPPPLPSDCLMPPPPPPPMCGTPPPPPLPMSGSGTPTPPPPPMPRMGGPNQWLCNRNQSTPSPTPSPDMSKMIPKNKKTIKLFWKEVKEDKSLLSRIMKKKTIWDEIKNISVDTQKLEHLFESRAKELINKKTQESGKKNEIVVLDTKRSNAINIGMTKLPPPRTVKTAILKMDATIMNKEGIEKILSMLPTEEEKTKILEAQMANPDVPLGSAESFLLTLSSISALEARLKLWTFRLDYDSMEREVAEPLMDLKQATAELEKCETFRIILGTLLSIGNFLNGVDAKGFQIDYLSKVPEVKDTVHKHSLLHHLCHIVMEKYPKSSDLYSELGAVSRASKKDFDEVLKSLQKMEADCKASWEHLKVIAKHDGSTPMKVRMSEFLADCAERIIVLGIIHRRVLNRFKKFLVFLGLPSHQIKDTKPNTVLKIISEFALEYRTTRERVKEQLEKKANHRERNKTRGKMITEMDKFKSKEQQADHELKQLLTTGSDYESEGGGRQTKWGTLPGTKLRRPASGSMTNLSNLNGTQSRPPVHYRHSVNIEAYTEADDEILESLVRTTTSQPLKNEQRNRRKARYGDRKSLRRTLKSGLDLSEEERLMLATLST